MNRARDWTFLTCVFWTFYGSLEVGAQEPAAKPTVLTIRPAKQPGPALRYRLVPERRELVPGNAAIFYHRACLMLATRARDPKADEKVNDWVYGPADGIDRVEARQHLESSRNVLHEVELGAFREECNWEFDRRVDGYSMLLPEIQEIRQAGRLVALKARLEILEGHLDQAFRWIEVGLAMSRHIGEAPFLIPGLVGISTTSQLRRPLEELIQTSGGPNLYWAFATRPRPLIDIRREIEGERFLLERELPGLEEVDGVAWSNEKARLFGDELFGKLKGFTGELRLIASAGAKAGAGAPRMEDLPSRLALAAMIARVYPEAKRSLLAEGRAAADVEAMPTLQVVLIHTLREYQAFRDDIFKWAYFPPWQTRDRMDSAWRKHRDVSNKLANPLLAMFTSLMPAIESARIAGARAERLLDAVQCIEAIRLYAAEHDGKLPDSLDAMIETPLPVDPLTGKPFEYKKVDEATAILSADYPPGEPRIPQYMIRYELKLVK